MNKPKTVAYQTRPAYTALPGYCSFQYRTRLSGKQQRKRIRLLYRDWILYLRPVHLTAMKAEAEKFLSSVAVITKNGDACRSCMSTDLMGASPVNRGLIAEIPVSLSNQTKKCGTFPAVKRLLQPPTLFALRLPVTDKAISLSGFLLLMDNLGSATGSCMFGKEQDTTGTFVQTRADKEITPLM